MNLRELTLEKAKAKLGVQEVGGDNHGPEVERYLKAAGLPAGNPWCAAFVNCMAQDAALDLKVVSPLEVITQQGFVPAYVDWAKKNGYVVKPEEVKPGMLFAIYFPNKGRYAHIGFVKDITADLKSFTTIEGNSNDEGSREGKEVCSNRRNVSSNVLFIHWTKVVNPKP